MGIKLKFQKLFNNTGTEKISLYIMVFVCFIGMICSTVLTVTDNEILELISGHFQKFATNKAILWSRILNNFALNLIFLIVPLVSGLSAVGYPFAYLTVFVKSLGSIAIGSFLYESFGIKGALVCALIIFPIALWELGCIILACNESVQMSKDISDIVKSRKKEIKPNLYAIRFGFYSLILLVSSLLYGILSQYIIKLLQ